jgi:hypothetical protein
MYAAGETEGLQGLEYIKKYMNQTRPDINTEIRDVNAKFFVHVTSLNPDSNELKWVPVASNLDEFIDYYLNNNRTLENPLNEDNCSYGFSFADKNELAINYMLQSITPIIGREEPICVADLGSGLGLSALLFMKKFVNFCRENHTVQKQPIELHLLDLVPENVKALELIKSLVNSYYSQYFKIETRVHDVVNDELPHDKFDFTWAFNLLHFIAESRWSNALHGIGAGMKSRGLLLITTDRGKPDISKFTIGRIRVADKRFPACMVCIDNATGANYLNSEDEDVIPGAYYSYDQIKLELIGDVQIWNKGKSMIYSSEEVRVKLQEGELIASLGNYVFNEKLLANSVEGLSSRVFETLPVAEQIDGTKQQTVALAFIKR